mgnify:CR=1 FL=1
MIRVAKRRSPFQRQSAARSIRPADELRAMTARGGGERADLDLIAARFASISFDCCISNTGSDMLSVTDAPGRARGLLRLPARHPGG